MDLIITIAGILLALIAGFFLGKTLTGKDVARHEEEAKERAKLIIREAESKQEGIKKEKILEAREKFLRMKQEHEEKTNNRTQQIRESENQLKQKEVEVNKNIERQNRKSAELESAKEILTSQLEIVAKRKEDLEKTQQEEAKKLEKVANLSAEEATNQLMELMKDEAMSRASATMRDIEEEAKMTATKKAKKIIIETVQRTAAETAVENCVSVFNIESDSIKGKIIGREGRNIRALEAATGIEIIVDDTPEAIILSGYDPVRREVAKIALHRLVQDGRIHPARIEEVVKKVFKEIDQEIAEIGERTAIDLNIHGLHPELIRMVGRMRFRSSYGQNLLQHSREVANMCGIMAGELGLNVKLARRAGLLHDIGKVAEEQEQPHAIAGMEMALKHKEHPEVCNAIGAHHDEIEMTCLIAPIIQACDAISGARPGARREVMDSYIKRLRELEETAMAFDGVSKCYAIQAGRELRVIVDAERIADDVAGTLSYEIAKKIETDMQYPGQIKVTVIREMRAVHFAK